MFAAVFLFCSGVALTAVCVFCLCFRFEFLVIADIALIGVCVCV